MALYDSENNRLLDTNDNVLNARSTFTIGTQEAKKIYVGENEVKAIYIGSNLVYEKPIELPQLSAPAISLDNDNLVIEEVENAEYYDIYVDGVLEHTIDNRPGIQVTLADSGENEFDFGVDIPEYSTDNGITWHQITSVPLTFRAEQIKFRGYSVDTDFSVRIGTTPYGTDILNDNHSGTMTTSNNITLSADTTFYFSIEFAD